MVLATLVGLGVIAAIVLSVLQRSGHDAAAGRLALLALPIAALLVLGVGIWQISNGRAVQGVIVALGSVVGLVLIMYGTHDARKKSSSGS